MEELAQREDVIALALHVDYWDYIGWKDEFADPAYTKRQKRYAHEGGRKMIYTPQMIVNGQEDVVGARSMELADLIARHRAAPAKAKLQAQRMGDRLVIEAQSVDGWAAPCEVQLVRYIPHQNTHITRGENAGKSLDYVNIVTDIQVIGQWDGRAPLSLEIEMTGDLPAVVMIQKPGPGQMMAAVKVE